MIRDLVRIRRSPNGLELGPGPGRGAWLCGTHPTVCLDEARRRGAFDRALRVRVGSDDIERLRARLDAGVVRALGEPGDTQKQ